MTRSAGIDCQLAGLTSSSGWCEPWELAVGSGWLLARGHLSASDELHTRAWRVVSGVRLCCFLIIGTPETPSFSSARLHARCFGVKFELMVAAAIFGFLHSFSLLVFIYLLISFNYFNKAF